MEGKRKHTLFLEEVVSLEATSDPINGLTRLPDPETDVVNRFAKTHSVSGRRQRKFKSAPRGGVWGVLQRARSEWRGMERREARRRIRESGMVASVPSVEVWGWTAGELFYDKSHRIFSTIFYNHDVLHIVLFVWR
jgi:hypothetical protein